MDREIEFGGMSESEFLELIGLDYLGMTMEDSGHEQLNSTEPQIHGSCPLDVQEQPQNETTINIANLPSQIFPDREVLLKTVREIAISQGFVAVIQRSKQNKNVVIGCDRGGSYRTNQSSTPKSGKKKSGTRLINCPFQIWGKINQDNSWRIEVKDLSHNHELSSDISGHPYARRFSEAEVKQIREMVDAGIAPRKILTKLRKGNLDLNAISRTLYNVKAKIVKESLGGRSMIQALMEELGKGGFIYDVETDHKGHVTHLLFCHSSSIVLARNYSTTFVMDCTYKTNKYKMPLLDIIGVTSFNTSFYCCFAFLSREEEKDYVWALEKFKKILGTNTQPSVVVSDRELALMNALKFIFPDACNLLCVWHIEKNILAKCKRIFGEGDDWDGFMASWTNLINSPTELQFNEGWSEFEVKYRNYKEVVGYIEKTWLPWKEKFVSAWSNNYMHFGHRVSSRAESAHATLKKYLQVSNGDLRTVKEKICHAIEHQFNEIKTQLLSEKIRVAHDLCIPFFSKLKCHVSQFALRKLLEQYELISTSSLSPICTGHFSSTMGLPCAHMMKDMGNEELNLECIHPQWRLDSISLLRSQERSELDGDQIDVLFGELRNQYKQLPLAQKEGIRQQISQFVYSSGPLILEPMIRQSKKLGSSSSKKKQTASTKRELSAFEVAQKVRKCSKCGETSHDRRKCPGNASQIDSTYMFPPMSTELTGPSSSLNVNLNTLPSLEHNFF